MTRNALLTQSLKPRPVAPPSVWRMAMDVIGQAFGAASTRERGR
ncbi:hypothetical protein [Brevundimonas sp.]